MEFTKDYILRRQVRDQPRRTTVKPMTSEITVAASIGSVGSIKRSHKRWIPIRIMTLMKTRSKALV